MVSIPLNPNHATECTIAYLEFAKHEEVSAALGAEGCFCKPYSSWEKGAVENFNGLDCQYYAKGCDFSNVTQQAMSETEAEINERLRKVHG